LLFSFAQTDTRATAVVVNEFDAGRFEGAPDRLPLSRQFRFLSAPHGGSWQRLGQMHQTPFWTGEKDVTRPMWTNSSEDRRYFVGGSDARIIMGNDEAAPLRLWREKRGEAEPQDLSGNLIVQLGVVTEELNRRWYEGNTGQVITDIQKHIRHPVLRWMRQRSMAGWRQAAPFLRPNSCCPGRSRKRQPPKSTCRSSSTTRG
jgi:hypothetical protein